MTISSQVLGLLADRRLVKMISGINNSDAAHVAQVVRAAQAGGASAVDVSARPELVKLALELTTVPVFASAVNPWALAEAVAAGAHVAEIGNFDALYEYGFYISAAETLRLARDTRAALPAGTLLSVTIPGHLSAEAQVRLAIQLEAEGLADMLQTEGVSTVVTLGRTIPALSPAEKLARTLENTRALTNAVRLPVMTASGIGSDNAAEAFHAGAAAVGVGTAISRLASEAEMVDALHRLVASVPTAERVPAAIAG